MSAQTWTFDGVGFDVAGMDMEKLLSFLDYHRQALEESDTKGLIREAIEEGYDKEGFEDCTDVGSLSEIIANVMSRETGICFEGYSQDEYGYEGVLFTAGMPWQFSKEERNLTEASLFETMDGFAEELGLENASYMLLTFTG